MRGRLRLALMVSVALHLVVAGWLATREPAPRRAADAGVAAVQWVDIELEAPAISRLAPTDAPAHAPPANEPPASEPPASEPAPREPRELPGRAAAIRPDTAPPPARETADATPDRAGGLLSMRDSARPGHDRAPGAQAPGPRDAPELSPRIAARAVEGDPHTPPDLTPLELPAPRTRRPPPSELIPDGNGTYRADDLVFRARIERDGRVHIEDKPNLRVRVALPRPSSVARGIESWYQDPYGTAQGKESAIESGTVPLLEGSFDLTDWVMRATGQDPYTHRKLAFLERTRDTRAAMSEREQTEVLRDALAALPEKLAEIWQHQAWPPQARRALLFQLWDECEEPGADEVARAGATARQLILAFIRRHLPRGSVHAYTDEELGALNRTRRSRAAFTPYP